MNTFDQASELRQLVASRTVSKVDARDGARVIAVASGKGGVGKSTVTLNLGIALVKLGRRVVIVDADLGLANLDLMLGISPRKTLWNYINSGTTLWEILVDGPEGIVLLPGGSGIEDMANLSPDQLERLVEAIEAIEAAADYLIIDTAAGIHNRVTAFSAAADRVVLVTAPESTAILDAYGLIKATCNHHPSQKFGVVMSMAPDMWEAKRHFEALRNVAEKYTSARLELLGVIPRDEAARTAVNKHEPLLSLFPRSVASGAFMRLGQAVITSMETSALGEQKLGFISRLMNTLSSKA